MNSRSATIVAGGQFAAVGAIGVVVNVAVTVGAVRVADTPTLVAAALGTVVSVVTNFLMLEHWVYRDRRVDKTLKRFALFCLIGGLDYGLRAPFVHVLTPVLGIAVATTVTLVAAFIVRFSLSHAVLWKETTASTPQQPAAVPLAALVSARRRMLVARVSDLRIRKGTAGVTSYE